MSKITAKGLSSSKTSVHASVSATIGATGRAASKSFVQATVRSKFNLAILQMRAAARFSRRVEELENIIPDDPSKFALHWEEILQYSMASVICCASSIEAYANELFSERHRVFPNYSSNLLEELWKNYERKPTLDKFKFALLLRGKNAFDESSLVFKDVKLMIELRNAIIHFKPEWSEDAIQHKKLSNNLKNKFLPSRLTCGSLIFPRRWATHGCTSWAIRSSISFTEEFERLADLPLKYPKDGSCCP